MTPLARLPLILLLLLPAPALGQAGGYARPPAAKKAAATARPAGKPPAAAKPSPFCAAMRKLPWASPDRIRKLIAAAETRRTEIGGTSEAEIAREIGAIEELVAPARLSTQMRTKLAETKQPDGDFQVVTPKSGAMYYFGSIGGSMKCRNDVWGQRFDDQIVYAGDGPDLGESCGVERLFGSHRGEPVLVQYEFAPKTGEAARAATPAVLPSQRRTEVRIVQTDKAKWGDVCLVKLK